MTIQEQITVMQAFADGKEIECCYVAGGSTWLNAEKPSWNWSTFTYRTKPNQSITLLECIKAPSDLGRYKVELVTQEQYDEFEDYFYNEIPKKLKITKKYWKRKSGFVYLNTAPSIKK